MNKCICGHEKEDHWREGSVMAQSFGCMECSCMSFRPAPKPEDRPEDQRDKKNVPDKDLTDQKDRPTPFHNHCWREDGTCYGAYGENGKCRLIHEGIKKLGSKKYYETTADEMEKLGLCKKCGRTSEVVNLSEACPFCAPEKEKCWNCKQEYCQCHVGHQPRTEKICDRQDCTHTLHGEELGKKIPDNIAAQKEECGALIHANYMKCANIKPCFLHDPEENKKWRAKFEAPQKENKKDWKKTFEEFVDSDDETGIEYIRTSPNIVKAFISQKKSEWESTAEAKGATQYRAHYYDKVEREARATLLKEIEEKIQKEVDEKEGSKDDFARAHRHGLQRALYLLKEKSQ